MTGTNMGTGHEGYTLLDSPSCPLRNGLSFGFSGLAIPLQSYPLFPPSLSELARGDP